MRLAIIVSCAIVLLTGCVGSGTFEAKPSRYDKLAAYRICRDAGKQVKSLTVTDSPMDEMTVTCK